jgi:hypothetical protein
VTSLDAVGTRGASALLPALCATTWTSRDANLNRSSAEHIITAGGRLSVTFRPTGPPSGSEAGYSVVSDQPARVPALVTNGLTSRARPDRVSAGARQGPPLTLQPSRVAVLPRAGDAGVVLPRAWLAAARPDGYDRYRPNQVWLSAAAPRDFAARLSAAGLAVRDVQSAAQRGAQLGAQGLSFALTMLVFGSAAAGGLAVAGAITSLLIASRRRVYEMAAIRALGSRARGVLGSLLLELGLITAAAALVGLLAGLVGARAALARLPAFVRASAFPPLVLDLPELLCVVVLAAVVVAMLGAAAVSGAALVRQASPGRLREAQA